MRKIVSVLLSLLFVFSVLPVITVNAETGTGGTVLDTDPAGGYEGDYVVIYNPSTSTYSGYSTGNMAGRIETSIDPYANVMRDEQAEAEPYKIDVDGLIANENVNRPKVEPPEGEKTSYNVGDTRTFTISNYSPGSDYLTFKCVAKGDHCYVWTPAQNLPNYYPLDAIDPEYPQLVCDEFEAKYPLMNSSFGDHSNGSQGDGRINLMYYNIDDGFQIGVSEGYVAGYFSSWDFSTNGVPMIHVDTYPCVYYVNLEGEEKYRLENSFNVFCHEYQHLINYSQTGGMDSWLNECMSAAAEEICYPGSSVISRIQSWERYYYTDNDDWLTPPHEFEYFPAYELHNGYSMYDWSNYLDYVLPLYSQVSFFAQYLYTHFGNTIYRSITQAYSGNCVSAISSATGMNTSQLVKNFRIAVVANDYAAYDGEYGFIPQEGYDPENYNGVQNPYDLLGPVVFTGNSCQIYGGGAITVKPVGGVYYPPSDASTQLVYIGVTRNIAHEPVALEALELTPEEAVTYVGFDTAIRLVRTPMNANDFTTEWTSSNPAIAAVEGGRNSAVVTGVSIGTATITCTATDNQTGNVYTARATVRVEYYPTLDDALNVAGGTLTFTTGGTYPWVVNLDHGGRLCANSSNINVSDSTSTVQTVVEMQQGETLTFEWSVSSETNYDKLKFYVNNTVIQNISGNSTGFSIVTYTAAYTGTFTFKWEYAKDNSVNSGSDCGFLDNVSYSGDPGQSALPGDVDMNGVVETTDALLALRCSMSIIALTPEQTALADVDNDGSVTTADALMILRMAMEVK